MKCIFLLLLLIVLVNSLRVAVLCGWHGREWATVELCESILKRPAQHGVEWIVISDVNPEGTELARSGVDPCLRVLPRSRVDPNRNFPPVNDSCVHLDGYIPIPEERAGEYPLSEPETRAVVARLREAMPIHMALFVHIGMEAFLYPMDACRTMRSSHHQVLHQLGLEMAEAVDVPNVAQSSKILGMAVGTASDWAHFELKIPLVYTLETYIAPDLTPEDEAHDTPEHCIKAFVPMEVAHRTSNSRYPSTRLYIERWNRLWSYIEEQHEWIQSLIEQEKEKDVRP
jgi:hypothetical protein